MYINNTKIELPNPDEWVKEKGYMDCKVALTGVKPVFRMQGGSIVSVKYKELIFKLIKIDGGIYDWELTV